MCVRRTICGCVVALGLVTGGCGQDPAPEKKDEGAMAVAALASTDAYTTLCPETSDTYSRGEARPTARMRRTAAPVVIDDLTPPQQIRGWDAKPWLTKTPIAVRLDGRPVEVAVMDSGDAKVGLAFDDWSAQKSSAAAYQRIRFLPCEGDPSKPTWFGWPGAIVADREKACVDLAIREENGDVSLDRVSLGDGCPVGDQ